jgi:Phosphotransferase enzyme family
MSAFSTSIQPTPRDQTVTITPAWRAGCPPSLINAIQDLIVSAHPHAPAYVLRPIGSALHSSGSLWSLSPQDASAAPGKKWVVKHGLYVKQEFDSLRRVWAAIGHTSQSETVPHPLALDAENRILTMSHLVVGPPLWSHLFGVGRLLRRDRAGAERAFRDTGRWLARFQRSSSSEQGPPPEIQDALDRLAQWPPLLSGLGSRLETRLREAAAKAVPGPLVLSHGDFAPRNVHCTGAGVAVLDWEMMPHGRRSPGYDLEHFRVLLDRHRLWLAVTANPARDVDEAFTGGYRESAPPVEPPANRAAVQIAARVVVLDRQIKASRRQPLRSLMTGRVGFARDIARQLESSR